MNLIREISDHIMGCISACVFGLAKTNITLDIIKDGIAKEVTLGQFIKTAFMDLTFRAIRPHRFFFNIFDDLFIGSYEKETLRNVEHFRAYIKKLADERKNEMG